MKSETIEIELSAFFFKESVRISPNNVTNLSTVQCTVQLECPYSILCFCVVLLCEGFYLHISANKMEKIFLPFLFIAQSNSITPSRLNNLSYNDSKFLTPYISKNKWRKPYFLWGPKSLLVTQMFGFTYMCYRQHQWFWGAKALELRF